MDYSGELEVKGKGLVKTYVLKKRVMSNEEAEEQAKHEEELKIGKENSQSVSFPQNNVPPPTPQRLESALLVVWVLIEDLQRPYHNLLKNTSQILMIKNMLCVY